jgi:hypothetical protein
MIQDIATAVKELPIDETRAMQSDYIEVVFLTADKARWEERIGSVLGPATKPSGQKPSKEDEAAASNHGGIGLDQVLFRKQVDGTTYVAMMWPWRDGEHITLKAATVGGTAEAAGESAGAVSHAPSQTGGGGLSFVAWATIGLIALIAVLVGIYWMM